MLTSTKSHQGIVVAPHHLAAQAGADILREGGNAIEAMVAAAASIAVAYPHMNGLGGDNFWLIHLPEEPEPAAIDACGAVAELADIDYYRQHGLHAIPGRGPQAALTVAGAISGWQRAMEISSKRLGGRIPLERLLAPAISQAKDGVAVTNTLANNIAGKRQELESQPGFAPQYLPDGNPLCIGDALALPTLADTFDALSRSGLADFYRGDVAGALAKDLEDIGSPLRKSDLERHIALDAKPLCLNVDGHRVYNLPPPTQGLASLLLLGVFDRLKVTDADGFDFVHGLVEATKSAFKIRDSHVCDPAYMTKKAEQFLAAVSIDKMASTIDRKQASPWPQATPGGDTVWLGAIDSEGRAVSFIQSIYWEFGSGVVLPETGITWQNRGTSFSLDPSHHNCLKPYKRPFHTIQPALAKLSDGRIMPYGTMGGEGQPQTQAMIFARHVMFGQELQQAVSAPRWLLGKTWGSDVTNLRIENRFAPSLFEALRQAGHDVEVIGDFDEIMGHAGALVQHPGGLIEGAYDPRSDGEAAVV